MPHGWQSSRKNLTHQPTRRTKLSKISLSGNPSGTGTFTIAAPNSDNSRTMTLPDSAGDVVVTQATQTLTNKTFSGAQVFGTASLAEPSGAAPLFMARAWVNFNGTGTVAIRASGNVSSITDNGTGDYTVNFTTAMPDANYSSVCGGRNNVDNLGGWQAEFGDPATQANKTTTSCRFRWINANGSNADNSTCSVHIFR